MARTAIVIGAGFAGLSAAASLARKGFSVTVIEKNESAGGRARVWREQGFVFDLGPSWYWMPEIFEEYFGTFGKRVEDLYDLRRLDPSYQVVFDRKTVWKIPAGVDALHDMFERIEPGAGVALDKFLAEARLKYELGMNDLVRKPALSWMEYAKWRVVSGLLSSSVFKSLRSHVKKHFKDERLRMLLEFPVLFLGAAPQNTPALYSLMNHADMALGTWYPMGGMGRLVDAMVRVAEDQGVRFKFNSPVNGIVVKDGQAVGVKVGGEELHADVVVAAADYHHVEADLLADPQRDHTEAYWQTRAMAPSSLIFYFGIDRRLPGVLHHNLFFDEALDQHSHEIYTDPQWPSKPLMYVCCPSITDPSVAPPGKENLFVLIPIAVGLSDTPKVREHYKAMVLRKLATVTGVAIAEHIVVERSYCINDFVSDYNSYRGNAYGLANTLKQTAVLKPSMKSKRVAGLYFAGQLTVPGPGVPPSLISGQVVADLIAKDLQLSHA
ncbi:MAG: phytoene desaturase [Flavobacteriales bacterium]|nr:MAG: phytoene desaturase [Flavobacteriales bacterium]